MFGVDGKDGGLNIKITGDGSDAQKAIDGVKSELNTVPAAANRAGSAVDDLGGEARDAAVNVAALGNRADAASRDVDSLGRTASFAATQLGVLTAVSAAPAFTAMTAAALPLVGVLGGIAAAAGGIAAAFGLVLGTGFMAWGKSLREALKPAQRAFREVATRIGQQFVPLVRDAFQALPKLVRNIGRAIGPLGGFADTLRRLGRIAFRVIPQIVGGLMDIARRALPVFNDLVTALSTRGPSAFKRVERAVVDLWPKVERLITAFAGVLPPVFRLGTTAASVLLPVLTDLTVAVGDLLRWFNDLSPAVKKVSLAISAAVPVLLGLIGPVTSVISAVSTLSATVGGVTGAVGGLGAALTALTGPVGVALAAIAGLAIAWQQDLFGIQQATKQAFSTVESALAGGVTGIRGSLRTVKNAIRRQLVQPAQDAGSQWRETVGSIQRESRQSFTMVRDIVNRVLSTVMSRVRPFLRELSRIWRTQITGSTGIIASAREAFTALWTSIIRPVLNTIQEAWRVFGDDLIRILDGVLGTLTTAVEIAFDGILTAINVVLDLISGDWEEAWNEVVEFFERTIGRIAEWAKNSGKKILTGAIGVITDAIKGVFKGLKTWLIGGSFIPEMIGDIASYFENAGKRAVTDAFGALVGGIESVMDGIDLSGIQSALSDVVGAAEDAISAISDIPDTVTPDINVPDVPTPDIPSLDVGGFVESTGLARVHAGERVIPAGESTSDSGLTVKIGSLHASGREEGEEAADTLADELRSRGFGQ